MAALPRFQDGQVRLLPLTVARVLSSHPTPMEKVSTMLVTVQKELATNRGSPLVCVSGDEDWESLGSEIFKYVLPPTLSTVQPRKSGRKREPSTDREDSAERRVARRRPRLERDSSPDEWPVVSSIPSRFQRLDRGSTPAVVTPRACDIRRLNSRLGSLVRCVWFAESLARLASSLFELT